MLASSSLSFAKTITVTVNGKALEAKKGETVMDLCDRNNIRIPRLCHHPNLPPAASCRVCLVECDGKWLSPSCITTVWDGLKIDTRTPKVVSAVTNNLNQLLSTHDERCSTCTANGRCQFRDILYDYSIDCPKRGTYDASAVDRSTHSIVLDPSKCVLCGRCVRACETIAGQHALTLSQRGDHMTIRPSGNETLEATHCIKCGQCTLYCPVGAIVEKTEFRKVYELLSNSPKKLKVVQVAPAVRVAIGEALGLKPGSISTGKLVSVLRALGFDLVYDTNFSADLTIIEEATELVSRLKDEKSVLPMFTSCCPAWVNYVEQSRPEFLENLSSCRSPMGMLSSLVKNYITKEKNVKAEDIINVAIMPCTAKKDEIERDQLKTHEGVSETDYVLTVRELADMIKMAGINFHSLEDGEFDTVFGIASGAGAIFAATGGVMEAAARTAFEAVTGKKLTKVEVYAVRGFENSVKIAELDLDGTKLKVAVCHGINAAGKFMDRLEAGEEELADIKFVEVMACPGGCVVGGGTSQPKNRDTIERRLEAIYKIDDLSKYRKSHDNPMINDLYKKFLGEPNGHLAHELLHTHYTSRPRVN